MATPFVHLEVIGPRASLDGWLAVLQDHGGCHLVDALVGLEGEPGMGRPTATPAEYEAVALREAAARVLLSVERVLPPSSPEEDVHDRPSWTVGLEGEDRRDLEALHAEALARGGRLQAALEAARAAEHLLQQADAVRLGVEVLGEIAPGEAVQARIWSFGPGLARPRRWLRELARDGFRCGYRAGARVAVVVARGDGPITDPVRAHAAGHAAHEVTQPEEIRGRSIEEARARATGTWEAAHEAFEDALAALRRRVDEEGPRARILLDALEDAGARLEARRVLAATENVVAARGYVRREDEAALRKALSVAFGREVAVRSLGAAPDAPALPRAVAGLPFGALEGLRPSRTGDVPVPALLALALPLLVGAAVADAAAGLALLFTGALIGLGAAIGSPRRDTALLAQLGGLVALLLGVLQGRAFGTTGRTWFGDDWALAPGASGAATATAVHGLVLRLGGAALLLGLWGLVVFLWHRHHHRRARAEAALAFGLTGLVVAGASGVAAPGAVLVHGVWLSVAAALLLVAVVGVRGAFFRLVLDLVGTLRVLAIGCLGLLLFEWAFGVLASPDAARVLFAAGALVGAALLVSVDAAYVAMGVPYDLALGGDVLRRPFTPFGRRYVRRTLGGRAA